MDERCNMCHINEDIANAFIEYYTNLFTTSNVGNLGECIHAIDSKVSSNMNVQLLTEFTMEEISQALGQMQAFKALGPDGFVACFYQQRYVKRFLAFLTLVRWMLRLMKPYSPHPQGKESFSGV